MHEVTRPGISSKTTPPASCVRYDQQSSKRHSAAQAPHDHHVVNLHDLAPEVIGEVADSAPHTIRQTLACMALRSGTGSENPWKEIGRNSIKERTRRGARAEKFGRVDVDDGS